MTPPGKEALLSRMLLHSRFHCIAGFIAVVLRFWPAARRGAFDFYTWQQAALGVLRAIERSGGRFSITGLANLRTTDSPVVFVANHMSSLETLVPPAFIYPHKKPVFVIKQELLSVPLFGNFVKGCIAVTRTSPTEDLRQVLNQGAEKIAQGVSVIIFPQASRSVTFDPAKFNTLGVKLARKAGVPVIPFAVKSDFWGNGKIIKDFGPISPKKTIYFEFGQPITVQGNGKQEHEQIVEFIKSRLERWAAEG